MGMLPNGILCFYTASTRIPLHQHDSFSGTKRERLPFFIANDSHDGWSQARLNASYPTQLETKVHDPYSHFMDKLGSTMLLLVQYSNNEATPFLASVPLPTTGLRQTAERVAFYRTMIPGPFAA